MGRSGPDANDDKPIRILHMFVSWTDEGIAYEAEQRHSELIVKELGLA